MNDLLSAVVTMTLQVASISDPGGRQVNEDACKFSAQGPLACFAVSDGVGGEVGGELAARTVVETILAEFDAGPAVSEHALARYLDSTKKEVAHQQSTDPILKNMSATIAVALVDSVHARIHWGHLGDTRIYHFRDGRVHRMTKDHSAVQQLVDAGLCAPERIRSHPLRSSLLGAIGITDEEDADIACDVAYSSDHLENGDALLLCTDGFWEWITESEMETTLREASSVTNWLGAMDHIAQHNSSSSRHPRDNYTAIAIRVADQEPLLQQA
ncbi:PP2C family protein-serine/threonine phosphatase [Herbaspirillum sp. GCM10030257]|uniref:PP2C family protein-serine/threonine phosphatase n=1 Tax=Herbaspirillum sp. GCM10030257 TaxID=3273393 RepID=UPI003614B8E8